MRAIFIWLCTILFLSSTAQNLECKLLDKSIHHELFEKHFRLCRIDTAYKIYNKAKANLACTELKLCNNSFIITSDTLYEKLNPTAYYKNNIVDLLVLSSLEKKGRFYELWFWQPKSNNLLMFKYKVYKNNIKLVAKNCSVI
jgi:hypothetical protein